MSTEDFMRGQKDCQEGNDFDEKAGEDYKRGYSAEESHLQVQNYVDGLFEGLAT